MPTLGIKAAREIAKSMIPHGQLKEFESLKFTVNNLALLSFLKRLKAISDEEFAAAKINIKGVVIAKAWQTKQGRELLATKEAVGYVKKIVDAAKVELRDEITRREAGRK